MTLPAFPSINGALSDDRTIYISVILSIVLFKIAILIYWGPGFAPDTSGYTNFADLILAGSDWLTNTDIETSAMPTTIFRIMGYPVLIALSKMISAEYWQWIVVLTQIALSTVSLICLSRLVSALGLRTVVGVFCVLSSGFSLSLLLDNMILTDSIAVSIFVIVLSENAIASLHRKSLGVVQALFFGLLVTLAFLVREGIAILSVLFVIPFLVRAYLAKETRWQSTAAIAVFFIPMVLITQIYMSWNESRTGYRFVTSGGQTVYLQGLVDAAKKDKRIFSGRKPIDIAARKELKDYSFSEVLTIQNNLFAQGYVAPELASMSKEKYFESWLEYPLSMLRMTAGHIRENYATLSFRPLGAVRQTGFWINGEKPWPEHRDLRKEMFERINAFILFSGEMIERVLAIVITIAFVFVPVIWFVRLFFGEKSRREEILVSCALWAVYFGVLTAHAMVHLEIRYLAAVVPFSTILGCLCIQRGVVKFKFYGANT